ncbi:EamA family transporter RarD [soil metagenome]
MTQTITQPPAPPTLDYAAARNNRDATTGLLYGVAAYSFWGIVAAYFKLIAHVPPLVVLSNRIAWSALFLVIVVAIQRRWSELGRCLRDLRTMRLLAASTIAISVNWFTFIWAVTHNQLLGASLGYFMSPLVTVLLALIVLRERLRIGQIAALLLAMTAVVVMVLAERRVPLVALSLGVSFSVYGLIRKQTVVAPIIGLLIETLILLPITLLLIARHTIAVDETYSTHALLALSGLITALPLLWFVAAARRLRLSTLGFLQYLSPTGQFILGRFVYYEPFSKIKLACFAIVWLSLLIFTIDSVLAYRAGRHVETSIQPE